MSEDKPRQLFKMIDLYNQRLKQARQTAVLKHLKELENE
jgi:hypothetical protein